MPTISANFFGEDPAASPAEDQYLELDSELHPKASSTVLQSYVQFQRARVTVLDELGNILR